MNKNNKKFWDSFSCVYDDMVGDTGDLSQRMVINPIVLNFLGNLRGKVVLDAGCGNGYLSRIMAKTAKKVASVDFTEKLIELAKTRNENINNLSFEVGNLEKLQYTKAYFDVILCNMVLINIENLEKVIKELSRILKINGLLVISITHPCFENPPYTSTIKDRQGNNTARLVKNYFPIGLVVNTAENNQLHFHYKISDYFNAFSKNNLFCEEISEPKSHEMMKIKEKDIVPYFLIIKLKKFG